MRLLQVSTVTLAKSGDMLVNGVSNASLDFPGISIQMAEYNAFKVNLSGDKKTPNGSYKDDKIASSRRFIISSNLKGLFLSNSPLIPFPLLSLVRFTLGMMTSVVLFHSYQDVNLQ